jgi:hypothetical protein
MEILSIDQIKTQFPDQWVLVGGPVLDDPNSLGSIVSKLIKGSVLFACKDKKELAYKSQDYRKEFDTYTCIYTSNPKTV